MKLKKQALRSFSSAVLAPKYDLKNTSPQIVHIGVGGFHRAHMARYLDRLINLDQSQSAWNIRGVGLLAHDQKMGDVLKEQDYLYTLVERDRSSTSCSVIGTISDFILAANDKQKLIQALAKPEVKIVSLTITEGGYPVDQTTGEFLSDHHGIAADIQDFHNPTTAFGCIIAALKIRKEKSFPPFTVLSCDNLQHNGDVARLVTLSLARKIDPELAIWIEANVSFPNSMVDRITPVTLDEDREMIKSEYGIDDAWPVVCETFIQWVIEDKFCAGRPPLERVGAQFVKDVTPYEVMKIRLLNASHSAMGYLGYLAGYTYIFEIAQDPHFEEMITLFMDREVTPILQEVPGINISEYKATLRERFANPNIKDKATRICMDGSNKLPKFLLPTIREQLKRGNDFRYSALTVAAWCRFVSGTDEKGNEIVIDDPRAKQLLETAKRGGKSCKALIGINEIFGDLAQNDKFITEVDKALTSLYSKGARKTLIEYLEA